MLLHIIFATFMIFFSEMGGVGLLEITRHNEKKKNQTTIVRVCNDISTIFHQLGPRNAQHTYRMIAKDFWNLHWKLCPMGSRSFKNFDTTKKKAKIHGTVNGHITSYNKLSMVLRYFAGGSPIDISAMHDVSIIDVYKSVWIIIKRGNESQDTSILISFLTSHAMQHHLAREFQMLGNAGFEEIVGATDGILVWTEQPNVSQCKVAGYGALIFC